MNRWQYTALTAFAVAVACHEPRVQHAKPPAAPAPQPVVMQQVAAPAPEPEPRSVNPLPSCDAKDTKHLFLVHTEADQVVLRSTTTECSTVLVPRASDALYDAALDLLWYNDRGTLHVLDMRAPSAEPVAIARGLPEEDLRVSRDGHRAVVEHGCDFAYVELDWTARPKIQAFLTEAPGLKLVKKDWLRAQFKRRLRSTGGERQYFSEDTMELPVGVQQECDAEESCGATVRFDAQGRQLVRVVDTSGGDCSTSSCLLYEPAGARWASPLFPKRLGDAQSAPPGPCGLFRFDRTHTTYLIGRWLCSVEQGCRTLDGYAVGWIDPGDTVGEPSNGNWQEP